MKTLKKTNETKHRKNALGIWRIIEPSLPPKHVGGVTVVPNEIEVGSVNKIFVDVEQPFASVTVHKYPPADKADIEEAVKPFDHKYVNGPVPPEIVTEIAPSLKPLQLIS